MVFKYLVIGLYNPLDKARYILTWLKCQNMYMETKRVISTRGQRGAFWNHIVQTGYKRHMTAGQTKVNQTLLNSSALKYMEHTGKWLDQIYLTQQYHRKEFYMLGCNYSSFAYIYKTEFVHNNTTYERRMHTLLYNEIQPFFISFWL